MSAKRPVHTRTQSAVHTSVYSSKPPGAVDFKGLDGCRLLYTLNHILYDQFLEQYFLHGIRSMKIILRA